MIETFLYTLEVIRKRYQSDFKRKNPYPKPRSPEKWDSVLQRFPTLLDGENTHHINFALDGEVLPYEAVKLKNYPPPSSFWSDAPGPPKSGKSHILYGVHEILSFLEISHKYFLEPDRLALPGLNDRSTLNRIRTHRIAERLDSYHSAIQQGGDLELECNFYFTENGLFHSLIFAHMQALLNKDSSILNYMKERIRPYVPMQNAVFLFNVPWHVSMLRGTKMPYNDLIAYHEGMIQLPRDLAQLTKGNKEPLAIINIDTTNRPRRETPHYVLRSLGTLLHGYNR